MQLLFNKDEQENISVQFVDKDGCTEFSYGEMIKRIYEDKVIDDSKIIGAFSEKEKKSISDLIDNCRKVIFEDAEQSVENHENSDYLF